MQSENIDPSVRKLVPETAVTISAMQWVSKPRIHLSTSKLVHFKSRSFPLYNYACRSWHLIWWGKCYIRSSCSLFVLGKKQDTWKGHSSLVSELLLGKVSVHSDYCYVSPNPSPISLSFKRHDISTQEEALGTLLTTGNKSDKPQFSWNRTRGKLDARYLRFLINTFSLCMWIKWVFGTRDVITGEL